MGKKVLIIGSGIGALASALRLSKKGFEVEIVEKNSNAGGRLNQLKTNGFTFDIGPSFFSMSYEFDELFSYCNIERLLQYEELNPLYTDSRSYVICTAHLFFSSAGSFSRPLAYE